MFEHYRTKGIIIKKEDRGEADQLFTIYTRDFGRLEILGKGIRKVISKLRPAAEIFYLSEIEFIQGKIYKTLTDAILIGKFFNLRQDLKRLAAAYRISDIIDEFVKGQEPDEKIWQLLNECFIILDNRKSPARGWSVQDGKIIYYYFIWNLLSFLGYQPDLFNCVVCQKKLTPAKLYFEPKEGGIICEKCSDAPGIKKGLEIKPEVVKILRLIIRKDWSMLSRLKVELAEQRALKVISNSWLSYYRQEFARLSERKL